MTAWATLDSPVGELLLVTAGDGTPPCSPRWRSPRRDSRGSAR